ncbi:MAG: hypothetical protein R3Y56_01165 [Akkermansia sp.]
MKTAITLLALSSLPALHAHELPETMTHQDYALALLDILSATEMSLAQCTDEQSRDAQIPHLKELAASMQELHQIQRKMPEPTIADYIAAEQHVGDFNTLWNAIKKHVQRLDEAQLYNEEMLQIIKLVH